LAQACHVIRGSMGMTSQIFANAAGVTTFVTNAVVLVWIEYCFRYWPCCQPDGNDKK
jgi:hypothetical protein